MKKIALALATAFAFSTSFASAAAPAAAPAAAAQPSAESTAAIKELLQAMNYRVVMKQSFEQMSKAMPTMMRQQAETALNSDTKLTDTQRKEKLAKMNEELPKVAAALQSVFNDPTLLDDMEKEMIPLYARYFTPNDMKQMAAFYRTPAGAKALQVMPQLMTEGMALGQRVAQPRIMKVMQQFQKK